MSLSTGYMISIAFALIALFLNMQWLFLAMLLVFAMLVAADSLSRPAHNPREEHGKHEDSSPKHAPPASFLDVLLANLIVDKHRSVQEAHRRHKEHEEHKKHEEKEKAEHKKHLEKEKEEHKHELEESREHLEAQLRKIEEKIYNTNKTGPPNVVKELQEQKKLLTEKLDEVIRRLGG